MPKLFKKLPFDEKRSIRYEILLTQKEAETIRTSAKVRNLCVADFMRRAALGRRADVRFETENVLALREIVQCIRNIYSKHIGKEIPISKEQMHILIDGALEAMLRIGE